MEAVDFWRFLARSAEETTDPVQRSRWLEYRLTRIPLPHIVDFQIHLDNARRPIDTFAMWGAANQIMDGLCGDDAFWYFRRSDPSPNDQPWDSDNLAEIGRRLPRLASLFPRRRDFSS